MAAGRPTTFDSATALEIISRISEGETVTAISKSAHMPNKSTIFLWSAIHKEFSDQYVMAMKASGQYRADKIIEVIEDMRQGVVDHQVANVEINALKWLAAKHYPKQYGDKTQIQSENVNLNANADISLSDADKAILERFKFDA